MSSNLSQANTRSTTSNRKYWHRVTLLHIQPPQFEMEIAPALTASHYPSSRDFMLIQIATFIAGEVSWMRWSNRSTVDGSTVHEKTCDVTFWYGSTCLSTVRDAQPKKKEQDVEELVLLNMPWAKSRRNCPFNHVTGIQNSVQSHNSWWTRTAPFSTFREGCSSIWKPSAFTGICIGSSIANPECKVK